MSHDQILRSTIRAAFPTCPARRRALWAIAAAAAGGAAMGATVLWTVAQADPPAGAAAGTAVETGPNRQP